MLGAKAPIHSHLSLVLIQEQCPDNPDELLTENWVQVPSLTGFQEEVPAMSILEARGKRPPCKETRGTLPACTLAYSVPATSSAPVLLVFYKNYFYVVIWVEGSAHGSQKRMPHLLELKGDFHELSTVGTEN